MLRKKLNTIAYFLALVFLLGVFGLGSKAFAQEDTNNTLVMTVEHFDQVMEYLDGDTSGLTLEYWKLDESYSYDNRAEAINTLHLLSEAELSQKFERFESPIIVEGQVLKVQGIEDGLFYVRDIIDNVKLNYRYEFLFEFTDDGPAELLIETKKTPEEPKTGSVRLVKVDNFNRYLEHVGFKLYSHASGNLEEVPLLGGQKYSEKGAKQTLYSDSSGEILVTNLPLGKYSFVEVETPAGYEGLDKAVEFEVKEDGETLIELRVVNWKSKLGGFKFLKVADDHKQTPLSGAVFRVTRKVGNEYEAVLRDGKDLLLTSGKDGLFEVDGLPYGDYYLWEVEAPKGYVLLEGSVRFDVNEKSLSKVLVIKNKRPPDVPTTGEKDLNFLIAGATLTLAIGLILARKNKAIQEGE